MKKEEVGNKKTASAIFVITSGIRQDPTCLWETKTKKFERSISQEKSETGNTVKTAVIKQNKGDDKWTSRFILITEHDLSRIPSLLKRICGDTDPENVAIIGRRYFLSKFSREKDLSRYHWAGDDHPFGWIMYLDRDGERLDQQTLASLANEIATVFLTKFENELEQGRLHAARNRTQRPL